MHRSLTYVHHTDLAPKAPENESPGLFFVSRKEFIPFLG